MELWGVGPREPLDAALLARVLCSPEGYRSKVPEGVTTVYFVNKAERAPDAARELAARIADWGGWPVFTGSLLQDWIERLA
jgi:hypothetical protein